MLWRKASRRPGSRLGRRMFMSLLRGLERGTSGELGPSPLLASVPSPRPSPAGWERETLFAAWGDGDALGFSATSWPAVSEIKVLPWASNSPRAVRMRRASLIWSWTASYAFEPMAPRGGVAGI